MDIDFPVPDKSDLVIKNNNSKDYLLNHAEQIIEKILKQE